SQSARLMAVWTWMRPVRSSRYMAPCTPMLQRITPMASLVPYVPDPTADVCVTREARSWGHTTAPAPDGGATGGRGAGGGSGSDHVPTATFGTDGASLPGRGRAHRPQ